ncbi:MAG: DUF3137 domain-containing protein [Alphaproteobacteria bacterium]
MKNNIFLSALSSQLLKNETLKTVAPFFSSCKKEEQKYSEEIQTLKNNFDEYYNTTIAPVCDEQEKIRLYYLNIFKNYRLSIIIFFLTIILLFAKKIFLAICVNPSSVLFAMPLIVAFVWLILSIPSKQYARIHKTNILSLFMQYFESFSYIYKNHIDIETLNNSMTFHELTNIKGDDYFKGNYKGVEIIISEFEANSKYKRFGSTKINNEQKTCILLNMNKNFTGTTAGILHFEEIPVKILNSLEKINLEDVVFDKIWNIFSNCQVEARYVLTTALMERILHLKSFYGNCPINFSFFNNKLLLCLNVTENMFETASLFKPAENKKNICNALEQILSIFSIVDILKLNKKIGM